MAKGLSYRDAGVDIDAGNETVRRIRALARATFTPGVLSDIGSFGGLFALDLADCREPVLVSSADGVGTKLKLKNKSTGVVLKTTIDASGNFSFAGAAAGTSKITISPVPVP